MKIMKLVDFMICLENLLIKYFIIFNIIQKRTERDVERNINLDPNELSYNKEVRKSKEIDRLKEIEKKYREKKYIVF